ncbi:hypothetical protein EV421DRAFT_724107 [Armillaria borealis]|uniref:HNH nuclease domain-containing protein n=1 Tax=Armillaria borealis TaxID=47425 RepID=A0AA39JFS9_9AGAR|nr:hypothetical protein EV421DRAFT_724107 [Armillaria borealis]
MTANGVSADVLLYVSNGPGQTDVTPEKYRDTLRAHCMDHWDWSPIVNFAHEYFTHLGLSMYTTLGPPTGYRPSGSDVDSPHFQYLEEIEEMLRRFDATGHSDQEGMIKLVRERDGKKCLFTNLLFNTGSPVVGRVTTDAELAHICLTKLANHKNPPVYQAFAVFWDDEEITKRFATLVNGPANCLLLSHDAHKNLEEMCWAMEAIENVDRDAWDYYFVKLGSRTFPYQPADRTRIKFGAKGGRFKNDIPLPSPELCNLRLAVTRVMRFSGAAEVVESWKDEYDDDPNAICSVLGHPYTDMVALERLDEQLSGANS